MSKPRGSSRGNARDIKRGGLRPVEMYLNGCRGKRRHTSKRLALGVIRVMRERGLDPAELLEAYKCQACHGWHVGNDRMKGRV